jgi:U1 zinc finger
MSYQQQQKRRGETPWRTNVERHYCAVCNVWMGSDKQSILLHENGKKHQEKAQEAMQQKRLDRLHQERQASAVQASMQSIESQARQALAQDLQLFADAPGAAATIPAAAAAPPYMGSMMYPPPPPPPVPPVQSSMPWNNQAQNQQQQQQPKIAVKQEKNQWESRKQKREEERAQKKRAARGEDDDDDEIDLSLTSKSTSKRRKIGVNEGHYTYGSNNSNIDETNSDNTSPNTNTIYLEGQVFGEILEEEMPIQLWTGPITVGAAERRLPEREMYWKRGLIAALRRKQQHRAESSAVPLPITSSISTTTASATVIVETVADVSYLENPETDTQETLVKSIPLDRIRIVLGDVNDERIPETLEEARLLAMGGEEVISSDKNKSNNNNGLTQAEIDEATGLSGWSTIAVKRTTVRQEEREERERQRRQRRDAAANKAQKEKEALERKMQEAQVANADDSALGAYDVYRGTKREGYKGVHIHENDNQQQVQAHEVVGSKQKLSEGKANVSFKSKKKAVKKQNRRTTSADDED